MGQRPTTDQRTTGIQMQTDAELETDLGPYASIAEANAAIEPRKRFIGKEVKIITAGVPARYWWSGGIADINLIAVTTGGPGGSITSVNGQPGPAVVLTSTDTGSIPTTEKGTINGVGTLDSSGKQPMSEAAVLSAPSPVNTPITAGMTPQQTAEALQGQVTQALANAGIPLQVETVTFVTRLLAKPNTFIDGATINEIDRFFVAGKKDGWLTKCKWIWMPFGSTMVSAVVNLYNAAGVPNELTNNNFVDADFDKLLGVGTGSTTNTNKYLDLGVTPDSLGITSRNCSYGVYVADPNPGSNRFLLSTNPATGSSQILVLNYTTSTIEISNGKNTANLYSCLSANPVLLSQTCGSGASSMISNRNGSTSIVTTPVGAATTLDTNLTLFKGTNAGTAFYEKNKLNFAFLGTQMTQAELQNFNIAVMNLLLNTGRIPSVGGRAIFNGDSLSIGIKASAKSKTYPSILSRLLGFQEYNISQGESQLRQNNSTGVVGGIFRYLDIPKLPQVNSEFIMFGTNDFTFGDLTTNGDSTIIADFKTKLTTIINAGIAATHRVFVSIPPFSNGPTITKQRAYQTAIAEACASTGVPVFNMLDTMYDQSDNGVSWLDADNVHLKDIGYLNLALGIYNRLQGKITRTISLDFAPILTGEYEDIVVPRMYGATTGNPIDLGFVPTSADIRFEAWVSASDTVTVRAHNTGLTTIDLAAFYMQITVSANY